MIDISCRRRRHYCLLTIHQLLFLSTLISTSTPRIAHALSSASNAATTKSTNVQQQQQVQVAIVEDYGDIMELADLRYDEFIASEDNTGDKFISKRAFRKATAEIHQERLEEGATVFLAKKDGVAAGAAELSPVEFQGAVDVVSTDDADANPLLYVTDVVTSQHHRRMGVGNALMVAMEQEAARKCCNKHEYACLFLHVEPDNDGALQFYSNSKLGYQIIENDNSLTMMVGVDGSSQKKFADKKVQVTVDLDKLAENAVTVGQVLMIKKIAYDGSVYSDDQDESWLLDGLEKQADENDELSSNVDKGEHTPDWLLDGLETQATHDDGPSTRITTDHLSQEPQYSSHRKLYPRLKNQLAANSKEAKIISIINICEFLRDTGATLAETLGLEEEELIVTMQHVLRYPVLRQGRTLCHWLKAKHMMDIKSTIQEVTDEEIMDVMKNVLQMPILQQGQILRQWQVIKKQDPMLF